MDFNASPQTGVDNGPGTAHRVWRSDETATGRVTVQAAGTWQSASLKIEISLDQGASPMVWTTAQVIDPSAGTASDAVLTADGTLVIEVTQGTWIRPIISSGSPAPALKVDFLGEFDGQ